MNNPPNESPELTAYALGELSVQQAGEIHALLSASPAAQSELEQIEAVTDVLRHSAPIPQQRLTPEQRHAVLRPTHIPRRIGPMMPRKPQMRKPAVWRPLVVGVTKIAAVFAVAACAFMFGQRIQMGSGHFADAVAHVPVPEPVASGEADADALPITPQAPVVSAPPLASVTKPVTPAPVTAEPKVVNTPKEAVAVNAKAKPVSQSDKSEAAKPAADASPKAVAAAVPAPPAKPAEAAQRKRSSGTSVLAFTTPPPSNEFVSTSRRPVDEFELRPASLRPAPPKAASQVFASPIPPRANAEPKEAPKPRPAELYIHSWKADVTSCPWNDSTRLLRVVVQLPADQPAAQNRANTYPLRMAFDPNTVREYRMLCERHQPAAELRSAGTHVVWYEFTPNGVAESARDGGRQIATVTLPAGRFTTQAVAPFDGSKLRILDRQQSWQDARDDFLFESSVVGFGLLLRGCPQTANLDHKLILTLAEKAKGNDADGQRAKFINLVRDAKRAAGL